MQTKNHFASVANKHLWRTNPYPNCVHCTVFFFFFWKRFASLTHFVSAVCTVYVRTSRLETFIKFMRRFIFTLLNRLNGLTRWNELSGVSFYDDCVCVFVPFWFFLLKLIYRCCITFHVDFVVVQVCPLSLHNMVCLLRTNYAIARDKFTFLMGKLI